MLACLNPNLEIYNETPTKYSVFNPKSGRTFSIGLVEYSVLKSLDGTKNNEQLSDLSSNLTVEQIGMLLSQFEKIGFIKGVEPKQKFNPIKIRKGLVNGNKWIHPENFLTRIAYFLIVYLSLPMLIAGLVMAGTKVNLSILLDSSNLLRPDILLNIPFMLIILSLHELGHAVVARKNGINVPEIGVMLYFFMPCAYTNLSSITFQPSKAKRLLILLAGMLVNMFMAGSFFLLTLFIDEKYQLYALWAAVSNLSLIVMNTLWVIKLDGYFLLEEILDIRHLREKSFGLIRYFIMTQRLKYKTKDKLYKSQYMDSGHRLDNMVYVVYGVLATAYVPILLAALTARLYGWIAG